MKKELIKLGGWNKKQSVGIDPNGWDKKQQ